MFLYNSNKKKNEDKRFKREYNILQRKQIDECGCEKQEMQKNNRLKKIDNYCRLKIK